MIKKTLITLAILGIIAGGYFALHKAGQDTTGQSQRSTITALAERRTIEEAIQESGFVEPILSTEVRSEVSGRIARIYVRRGQEVAQGDILVELDRVTLLNDLAEAERNLQSDQLRLDQARRDYLRLRNLHTQHYAQEKELLDAETSYKLAEIQVAVSETRIEKAQENLSKTTIRAPHGGIVADLDINEGQVIIGATSVNQGTVLMTLNDLSKLHVTLDINELDIAKIRQGMPAQITFDSLPGKTFKGIISEIHPFAINQNNLRVFRVEVTFDTDGQDIRPGISADIRIVTGRVEDAVVVTLSAVFTEGRERYVHVINPSSPDAASEKRPVTTGISNNRFVEIREGLSEGETVSLLRPRRS